MKSSIKHVFEELKSRGITAQSIQLEAGGTLLMYQYKDTWRFMVGVSPDLTSSSARTICNDKTASHKVAQMLGLRVPITEEFQSMEQAELFLQRHKKIVVKPRDGAHGNGVSTGIETSEQLMQAMDHVQTHTLLAPLLQKQVAGLDYRLLVIGGKVVAGAQRVAARVVGDGEKTIRQLIVDENDTNADRGLDYERRLNKIDIALAQTFLGTKIDSVPSHGEIITVVGTANIGTGGEAIDITGTIPETMVQEAQEIANVIGAFTVGVDFLFDPITKEWYLIELNSSPSFGLHMSPSEGKPIDIPRIFVDALIANYDAVS